MPMRISGEWKFDDHDADYGLARQRCLRLCRQLDSVTEVVPSRGSANEIAAAKGSCTNPVNPVSMDAGVLDSRGLVPRAAQVEPQARVPPLVIVARTSLLRHDR